MDTQTPEMQEGNSSLKKVWKIMAFAVTMVALSASVLWYLTGSTPIESVKTFTETLTNPVDKPEGDKTSLERTQEKMGKFASF